MISSREKKKICSVFLLMAALMAPMAPMFAHAEEEHFSLEQSLINDDIAITRFFETTAQGLDLFLVGKQVSELPNKTHVLLENSTYLQNDQKPNNQSNLNLRLSLPNFEEYWQLKFSSYDEEQEKRNVEQGLGQTPKEKNYGATVGFFRTLGNVKVSFQPRVEFRNPLDVAYNLSFESVAEYKHFKLNPELELFANPDDGVGNYLAINANFRLSNRYTLTDINNGEYSEKKHLLTVTHGLSLGYVINQMMNLSYNWLFFFNNQTNYHLQGYSLSVAFSHELYKQILSYQAIPHWDFDKDSAFVGSPGFTFNLILRF